MPAVELATSGTQTAVTGLARVTVTDPDTEVRSVDFYLIDKNKRRIGPLTPDRALTGGVYEKDVILDIRESTRVEPEVVLADGSVLKSAHALFGARYEPIDVTQAALASLTVTPSSQHLTISVSLGTAILWKCFARLGQLPTADGTAWTAPSERYLREWDSTELSFSMGIIPGTWHVIAIGYNSAGQPGPRSTVTAQVAP